MTNTEPKTREFDMVALEVERYTRAIPCDCGGFCDQAEVTDAEDKKHGCSRYKGCCSRAFVCRVCKTRWVGSAPAPEMD